MFKDNPLLQQLKQQMTEDRPLAEGVVKATDKSFGFLLCDNGKSYFIAPPHMKKLLHGDRIRGSIIGEGEKQSVEPEALLESVTSTFLARMYRQKKDGRPFIVSDHPLMNTPLNARISKAVEQQPQPGDWVMVKLLRHAFNDGGFLCEISEFVASNEDNFANWKATTARHRLAWDAPVGEANHLDSENGEDRVDATNINFFTIDAPTTQDMDDAISIQASSGGWIVTVAVADASAFIRPEQPLEQEARKRAFTLYLPGRTVPMLPHGLADDLCSLKPDEHRPALCCEFMISQDGHLDTEPKFYSAWIRSKHRLSYEQVSDWVDNRDNSWEPDLDLATQLLELKKASQARNSWRQDNAIVFSDRPDYRFEISQDGKLNNIIKEQRTVAHQMVEEAMIAANTLAGHMLNKHLGFGVFNTHIGFDPSKLAKVQELVNQAGIDMSAKQLATFEGFCHLKRTIAESNNNCLDIRLRRFYHHSEFSAQAAPHFGLGERLYATWTSPIRKYSDLLNHRLLKTIISGEKAKSVLDESLRDHLDQCRRVHRIAERNMADYLYSQHYSTLLKQPTIEIGELYDITRGGIRVKIDSTGASAFIPASKVHPVKGELLCDSESATVSINHEIKYRLGDIVKVKVVEINESTFSLIAELIS